MLNGLIKPDEGRIDIRGRVGALISLGAGFSPILTGRENIYVNAAVLGLTRQEIHHKIGDIIDFAGIREFIDAPVQSYSSGMQVRLGFSIASALNPDVLLLDEILAVGDTAFRSKCFQRIGKLLDRAAVIFVSHSEAQVSRICDSTMLLDSGMVRHLGNTAAGLRLYRESQRDQTLECHVVTHADVVSAAIARISAAVVWGGELAIDIVIELRDTVTLGQILVHLSLDNDYKANSEVHIDGACKPNLCAGRHIIRCSISPLHLAYGRYQVSVSIFDSSGKMTVVQLLDAARIEIIGPSSGGCAYLLPMSYEIVGATLIKDIDYNA